MDIYRTGKKGNVPADYPDYPFNSKEADRDFLAAHNYDMMIRGIDPRTGKVFSPQRCGAYARKGDKIAQKAYREWQYENEIDRIHPKLAEFVFPSYNNLMRYLNNHQVQTK